MTFTDTRLMLGGSAVDLREFDETIDSVADRARSTDGVPLVVASINLDHVHHFGTGSRLFGTLDDAESPPTLEWLNLIDGAPLASQAGRLTGRAWPRLAGSDLIGPILAQAERDGTRIGFLGGAASTHAVLREQLAITHPALTLSGCWAPEREELSDVERSLTIADEIRAAGTDMLIVGLGKPRQELWIAEYGEVTGARVLLAFGAVVDFLAGRVSRAPHWIADHGLEWAWRLTLEPRRLASRYLVNGPPAYLAVRRSRLVPAPPDQPAAHTQSVDFDRRVEPLGSIIIPAHNEEAVIARTLASIEPLAVRNIADILVVCNGCSDSTALIAARFPHVRVIEIAAASKNAAMNAGDAEAGFWPRLYLDADIEAPPEAIISLFTSLRDGRELAGRPTFRYATDGASWLVRSYYRARTRMPTTHGSLWGAGAYAVTAEGHERFESFPALFADDLYVDSLFTAAEKRILDTPPILVRTPLRTRSLVAVLTRQAHSNVPVGTASTTGSSLKGLVVSTRSLTDACDTAVYASLTLLGRLRSHRAERKAARGGSLPAWERDLSSRPNTTSETSIPPLGTVGPPLGGNRIAASGDSVGHAES